MRSTLNPIRPHPLESVLSLIENELHNVKLRHPWTKSISKEQYKVIKSLRNNNGVIIKPEDKGSIIITMDKSAYIQEGEKQLSDTHFYEMVYEDPTGMVMHKVNLYVHNMLEKGESLKTLVNIWPQTLAECNYYIFQYTSPWRHPSN